MFFYLAKILWFVAQPSSVITLVMVGGAILARGQRHCRLGQRLLAGGLAAFLVCGFSPLAGWMITPLENRFARADLETGPPVTGIIVLGGAEDARWTPRREIAGLNEAAERFTEGVALALRLPQARLVFSGGSGALIPPELTEADTAERLFTALGIPRSRLTLEDRSRDTYENAVFTKRLLDPKPGERWLLVTSAWHMPRAIGCFRKAGFSVEAWPVDYRTSGKMSWAPEGAVQEGLRRMDFITREYVGLVMYFAFGRTSALLPAP